MFYVLTEINNFEPLNLSAVQGANIKDIDTPHTSIG